MTIKDIYESDKKYSCYVYQNFHTNVDRLAKKLNITLKKAPKKGKRSSARAKKKKSANAVAEGKTEGWLGSKARSLLLKALMDKKSYVHNKTDQEIYDSHKSFKEFEPIYFQSCLTKLRKKAETNLRIIAEEEAAYEKDCNAHPRAELCSRGYPHWQYHPADKMLREDVKSGLANTKRPLDLWQSRDEYQDFPLDVFRGHIYQESRAQREANYWVPKRNKDAQRARDKEAKQLKEEWKSSSLMKTFSQCSNSGNNAKQADLNALGFTILVGRFL